MMLISISIFYSPRIPPKENIEIHP